MKRTLALIMVLVLALAMSPAALAVGNSDINGAGVISGDTSKDVIVSVNGAALENAGTIYYVELTWQDLAFTYRFDGTNVEKVWDPENHVYTMVNTDGATDVPATGSWNQTSASITAKNHSNAAVKVSAVFNSNGAATVTKSNVQCSLSTPLVLAAAAENSAYDSAPSGTLTVTVANQPTVTTGFTLDRVNVVLAAG